MLLLTVILMDLLSGMELDIFVPSFLELQNYFNLSSFDIEALLSVNFIGFCISLFFVGSLADRFGRKPIILIGLFIFIIASFICLYSVSFNALILGRFLQGIGIAAPSILCFLVISDNYSPNKQQSFMALLNGAMNVSVGAAPIAGSYITLYFNWQGNFVTLGFFAILIFILTIFFIPAKPIKAFNLLSPVTYSDIFKNRNMVILIINFIFIFVPYWIFVGITPLLYMEEFGMSLLSFGYYQGIVCFAYGVGSVVYSLFINKFDKRKMLFFSCFVWLITLFFIIYAGFENSKNPLFITGIIVLFCMGQIFPTTILFPLCLNYMPDAKAKVAAIIQAGRLLMTSLSLQIAGYLYNGSFTNIALIIGVFIFLSIISLFLLLKNILLIKEIKLIT